MNKTELIERVATECDISKAAAARAVDSIFNNITETLKNGGEVNLVGFGSFAVVDRAARMGRNPQTNVEIKIPATRVPKFKAGKFLKDAVK